MLKSPITLALGYLRLYALDLLVLLPADILYVLPLRLGGLEGVAMQQERPHSPTQLWRQTAQEDTL